ncbi:hypothetical protein KCU78_g6417, partial [Aureobasidium melanogenum]
MSRGSSPLSVQHSGRQRRSPRTSKTAPQTSTNKRKEKVPIPADSSLPTSPIMDESQSPSAKLAARRQRKLLVDHFDFSDGGAIAGSDSDFNSSSAAVEQDEDENECLSKSNGVVFKAAGQKFGLVRSRQQIAPKSDLNASKEVVGVQPTKCAVEGLLDYNCTGSGCSGPTDSSSSARMKHWLESHAPDAYIRDEAIFKDETCTLAAVNGHVYLDLQTEGLVEQDLLRFSLESVLDIPNVYLEALYSNDCKLLEVHLIEDFDLGIVSASTLPSVQQRNISNAPPVLQHDIAQFKSFRESYAVKNIERNTNDLI